MPGIFEKIVSSFNKAVNPEDVRADKALGIREKEADAHKAYYNDPQRHQRDLRATFGDRVRLLGQMQADIEENGWQYTPDQMEKAQERIEFLRNGLLKELQGGPGGGAIPGISAPKPTPTPKSNPAPTSTPKPTSGGINQFLQGAPPAEGTFKSVMNQFDQTRPQPNFAGPPIPKDLGSRVFPKKGSSPYPQYPDAFKENDVWKVIRNGQKFRIED